MIVNLLIFISILFLLFQCIYWIVFFFKVEASKSTQLEYLLSPVSIIVCFQEMNENLIRLIEDLLNQNYLKFEIILVHDAYDVGNLKWVLKHFNDNSKLTLLHHQKTRGGKKDALSFGIKKATYTWILLSDADCWVCSQNWITNMVKKKGNTKKIVVGYAPFHKESSWINKLIRFECIMNALQYMGAIEHGLGYMGVGRNLLYHRTVGLDQDVFPELEFGDDDLKINKYARDCSMAYCLEHESFVYSFAAHDYISFFQQKRRHYATSNYYSNQSKIYLGIYFLSLIGFYLLVPLIGFIFGLVYGMLFYILRIIPVMMIFKQQSKWFKEQDLVYFFPVWEFLYVLHVLLQLPLLFIPKKKW
ncbi:MAG: glycosyltransferase [Bacteroidota bacterium]|nr:glycosyltransferase [Bacteroidota bacterium]